MVTSAFSFRKLSWREGEAVVQSAFFFRLHHAVALMHETAPWPKGLFQPQISSIKTCCLLHTSLCTVGTDVNNTHQKKLGNYFGHGLIGNNHTIIRPPKLWARPQGVGKGPAKGRTQAPSTRVNRQSSLWGDRRHEFPQPAHGVSTANTANTCAPPPTHWFLQLALYSHIAWIAPNQHQPLNLVTGGQIPPSSSCPESCPFWMHNK